MEKTIKINIAGVIFQINEDGFELLRDYLQSINNRLKNVTGGNEMIEDIEARIAEIFQSAPSWKTGVISTEDVEEMMSVMGTPDEIAGETGSESSYSYTRPRQKRLYRDSENSIIGGVCSGLGAYLRIDPVWIRILFVLFSIVYLSGLFVYIILWIALPRASTPFQRKEMHDPPPSHKDVSEKINQEFKSLKENVQRTAGSDTGRKVGNAFNEVFKAFGKFFVILFRIIIALIGVTFIISGFSLLFSFIIIAFFNTTAFMSNVFDTEVFHLPDFLSFVIDPALTPWLMVLSSIVIMLPLIGIIYWGIRMVFQFRAKDLVLNISMLILWIVSVTALSLLLFSEGISFSNSGRTTEEVILPASDTLYIRSDNNLSALDYDREVHLPFEDFALFLNEEDRIIYGRPEIDIYPAEDEAKMQIVKYSNGRSRSDAMEKADNLDYGYNSVGDNILFDEYFTIPEGNRWSGAYIKVKLYIPEGKCLFIEEEIEDIFDSYIGNGVYSYELGDGYWRMTDKGLEKIE